MKVHTTLGRETVCGLPRVVAAYAYLLVIDVAAVAVAVMFVCTGGVPSRSDGLAAGWMTVCAFAGVEASERVGSLQVRCRRSVYADVNVTWLAALAVLFPPGVTCVATAAVYAWVWHRVVRRDADYPLYRWATSAASRLLASGMAAAVFDHLAGNGAGGGELPSTSPSNLLGVCLASIATAVVVNTGLVAGAIRLATPRERLRQAGGAWPAAGLSGICGCLGVLTAVVYTAAPALIVLVIPIVPVLQRALCVAELQTAARTDPKTGLANPGWWTEQAERELVRARRTRRTLSVVMADLDHFKNLNDTWGHLTGDQILRAAAKALAAGVRQHDVVGRFGGEEFVILLPETSCADALDIAERLRARVAEVAIAVPRASGTSRPAVVRTTISLGVASEHPERISDVATLVGRADAALYDAKRAGRNRVAAWSSSPLLPVPRRNRHVGSQRTIVMPARTREVVWTASRRRRHACRHPGSRLLSTCPHGCRSGDRWSYGLRVRQPITGGMLRLAVLCPDPSGRGCAAGLSPWRCPMAQTPRELTPDRSALDLFGAELRHWRELRDWSQNRLAEATHFSHDLISKVEKAERWPSRGLADSCDRELDTGGALGRIWPLVEREHRAQLEHVDNDTRHVDSARPQIDWPDLRRSGATGRAHTDQRKTHGTAAGVRPGGWRAALATPVVPQTEGRRASGGPPSLEEQIVNAWETSAQYEDHPSNVGPAMIDQLRADATRLARSFANAPRHAVFAQTQRLRDRVFALLEGRQRVSESRDLYFLAGATCGMLAEITEDFGYLDAAMAHARTGLLCAKESGHDGLMAWIRRQQSMIAYHDGRFGQAANYARRGQEHAPAGTVAVALSAMEARAAGRLGDAEASESALRRASDAREHVRSDELDEMGGILHFPVAKQHFYATQSYLGLGDATAVVQEGQVCVSTYRAGPEEDRALDNEAVAQVDIAAAHVLSGELDAAKAAAQPALNLAWDLRTAAVDKELRHLLRRLTAPGIAGVPVAVELRDQIEDFLAVAGRALP